MDERVIVKVMNFHSLIRVDKARRKAEKYTKLESEVSSMIDVIVNNRNFILDQSVLKMDETKPKLNIYFGSDYGFCGSINSSINKKFVEDSTSDKIVVGKKLREPNQGLLLKMDREQFLSNYKQIKSLIYQSITGRKHSEINVIYHHFHNTSDIKLVTKKIYPIEKQLKATERYKEDYYVEGDPNQILLNLITSYLDYEIQVAQVNSYASENIIRQNATTDSLIKIDEREEQQQIIGKKKEKEQEFRKIIDSYTKMKKFRGDQR